jgi:23S rRNA pseudouridine2605 synthase
MKKRTDNFDKFSNKKKNSAVKEGFRQEKKKIKTEARAAAEVARQRKFEKQVNVGSSSDTSNKRGPKTSSTSRPSRTSTSSTAKTFKTASTQSRIKQPEYKVTSLSSSSSEQMPLNKYIAHSGVCGRREAAELVKGGQVTVNGDTILEPGHKVTPADTIKLKGKTLRLQVTPVYVLLNKPKDFICTADDPQGRKTVMDIVKNASEQRLFPVGRLDRNTTGVLLLTNDGDLAQKLTHPSYGIKKIYEVTLDKPVTKADLEKIASGIDLEDGFIAADAVSYASSTNKNIVGIEIHSGKNRIVRRIFESLGYDVRNLDRVMFANLTKKNVDRGKWRFLSEKEVRLLKFLNKSFTKKSNTK